MNYRWELMKHGKKMICPACGQRRFVPYVSTRDHRTLAGAEYGRCDRENNCGYHRYPSEVPTDKSLPIVKIKKQQPIRFHQAAVRTDYNTNLFVYAVRLLGYEKAKRVWDMYHISAFGSATVFWQISKGMEIRAGKAISYGTDGHRIKDYGYPVWWLHKCRQTAGWFEGQELQQCFFGEHLLAHEENKDKTVCIVESEKTAALMSAIEPDLVWLACGGSQNLKNDERNKVLRGCNVRLCPDDGQYNHWVLIANKYGWDCDYPDMYYVFDGCDILDYYEKKLLNK